MVKGRLSALAGDFGCKITASRNSVGYLPKLWLYQQVTPATGITHIPSIRST